MPITTATPRGTLAYRTHRTGGDARPGEFVVLLDPNVDDGDEEFFMEGLRFKHPTSPHSFTGARGSYYNNWLREIVDDRTEV